MADSRHITRRALLKASPAVALIAAVPIAAHAAALEESNAKVRRLQRQLSDALAELMSAPTSPCDFVSIVYPSGTANGYTRTLIERDIFEECRVRETLRSRAIDQWRSKDQALQAAFKPFDRTRWEFASLDENNARDEMLRTFRTL